MRVPSFVARTLVRLLVAGAISGLAVWTVSWAIERARFGPDTAATRTRLAAEVNGAFAALSAELDTVVRSITADAAAVRSAEQGSAAARITLFDQVEQAVKRVPSGQVSVTIYGAVNGAVAWAGRSENLRIETRLAGPASVFLAPSSQGLQLVHVQPLVDPADGGRRVGAIVAAVPLAADSDRSISDQTSTLPTTIVPVVVRPQFEGAGDAGRESLIVRTANDQPLASVVVADADLMAARDQSRQRRSGLALAVLALWLLLLCGPLLDWRRSSSSAAGATTLTVVVGLLVIAARALGWVAARLWDLATPPLTPTGSWSPIPATILASPIDFLLTSLAVAALVALAASSLDEWRSSHRRGFGLVLVDGAATRVFFILTQLGAGSLATVLILRYEFFLRTHYSQAPVDVLRFALGPLDPIRLLVVIGVMALNAAVLSAAIVVLRFAASMFALAGGLSATRARMIVLWLLPAALLFQPALSERAPLGPTLLAIVCAVAAAWTLDRLRATLRHSSQFARLLVAFLTIALPSIVLYPSLVDGARLARRQLVESRYAPEVLNQRRDIQVKVREALIEIDRIEALGDLVKASDAPVSGPPATDAAFLIWSQTSLASQRLTSSVELHNMSGAMVSRFALKLPDYPQPWVEGSCDWEILEEVSPFFAEERRLLHAGKLICDPKTGRHIGSVVVHVMLDYQNLSFISARSPYVELMRAGRPRPEPRLRADVEFDAYGWSRRLFYSSVQAAPSLPDEAFAGASRSRDPFWITVDNGQGLVDAYVLNDRFAIYLLATARQSWFGHLVTLAEMITLAFVLFVTLLAGTMVFGLASARAPASGRMLLDEVRASFYRKLFLAFVAAAIVPVLAMAVVSRAYIAGLMQADIQSEATRTASVTSRIVEDFGSQQARGVSALFVVDDNLVVWLSRVIAQDVNIFDGPNLLASSERNLFASGLLPTRTPGEAYRAILLEGRPGYVGRETAGGLDYLLAAAPVRVQDRAAVLTVPLTTREQETEAQTDELDRRVLLAALVFIMLGAAIGYYMAERIADPVNRLMRATRRIARGDLDVQVLTTSSDELRRLVDAFNQMAADLQRQRKELERTNRLEAWADMARQVAHDIKNPLTPIQLNAEHLIRVHDDRGRPLGGVLDDCIRNILGQVRLLRQISSEFSSFASSPEPKPVDVSLADLVHEVVEPYRAGLANRVTIETAVPADLPMLRIDRTLIGRALTNVIENALHAMPGGGRLTITAANELESVRLDVTDTGVGMDAESIQRIFEPYFSTKAIGTGLGLTIAKRNVEANGGEIAVTSQKGRGTKVALRFPVGPHPAS